MSWENNIRKVIPYVPGEQPNEVNMIKLNTNECPYPPAPEVAKAARELECNNLRLYPNTNAQMLVDELATYYNVDSNQIFVGVGSDDVLAMSFLTFFNSESPILFPDITYSFYDVWAQLFNIPYKLCNLNKDMELELAAYQQKNGGIIFPNPNAPTGVLVSLEMIEEVLKANKDVIVIVDEAYIDFGGETAIPLIEKYDNLLVVQTFSKSRAMAGARIGFAIGNKELIKYLNDVKFSFNSYTMNLPAQVLGVEAIRNDKYFKEITEKIINTRERVKCKLLELDFSFPDSKTNFIFATHNVIPAKELYEALKKNNIFVRYFSKPIIDNYLRITIGTDEEMDIFLKFIQEYIENRNGENK